MSSTTHSRFTKVVAQKKFCRRLMSGQSVHQQQQASKGVQAVQRSVCNAAAIVQTRRVHAGCGQRSRPPPPVASTSPTKGSAADRPGRSNRSPRLDRGVAVAGKDGRGAAACVRACCRDGADGFATIGSNLQVAYQQLLTYSRAYSVDIT